MSATSDGPSGKTAVAIVDYQLGNLFSVCRACDHVGLDPIVTSDPEIVRGAAAVVLPGVGAFGDAMRNLEQRGLREALTEYGQSGRPFLGICLGLQLLFSASEEFGDCRGLDLVKGTVSKLPSSRVDGTRIKVPHVGWNRIEGPESDTQSDWRQTLLEGVAVGEQMYFVHSYHPVPDDPTVVLTITDYLGVRFCSGIRQGNLTAFQFHPEKSGQAGMKIYQNFASLIREQTEVQLR